MPGAGLEPAWGCPQGILSQAPRWKPTTLGDTSSRRGKQLGGLARAPVLRLDPSSTISFDTPLSQLWRVQGVVERVVLLDGLDDFLRDGHGLEDGGPALVDRPCDDRRRQCFRPEHSAAPFKIG